MTRPVDQRPEEWLTTASPEEIAAAYGRGELAEVLGGEAPLIVDGPIGPEDFAGLTPEQIAEAARRGLVRGVCQPRP